MNLNKTLIVVIILVIIILAILYPWIQLWFGLAITPDPSEPHVKCREIEFKLQYKLQGEKFIVDDVAYCDFDGYSELTESGKHRKWKVFTKGKTSLIEEDKNEALCVIMLDLSKQEKYDEFGHKILELYFYGGNGHYYMSDELGNIGRAAQSLDYVCYRYESSDGKIGHSAIDSKIAKNEYQIELLDWSASAPIKTTFK